MKALFILGLKRLIAAFALSLLICFIVLFGINHIFAISNDRMGFFAGLSYLISLAYFAAQSSNNGFRFRNHWQLLLPEPRSRPIAYSLAYGLIAISLGLAHMAICFAAYSFMYEPSGIISQIDPKELHWSELVAEIKKIAKPIILVEEPVAVSFIGAFFIILGSTLGLGSSPFLQAKVSESIQMPQCNKSHSIKTYLPRLATFVLFGAACALFVKIPNLIPWMILLAMCLVHPTLLARIYALSSREARRLSHFLIHGPALVFTIYFSVAISVKALNPDVEKRELASIYVHSLLGQKLMSDRRKVQLAGGKITSSEAYAIRKEFHTAYGTWFYGSDFPVSFSDTIREKEDVGALVEAIRGFDNLGLSDDDATLFLQKFTNLNGKSKRKEDLPLWSRFRPSEGFSLRAISSRNPAFRSFGLFTAMNAPPSAKIRAAIVRAVKAPEISDSDLRHAAISLSIHLRKQTSISWMLRANPNRLPAQAFPGFDCQSFRGRTWKDIAKDPARYQFINICLRDFASRQPLDPNFYNDYESFQPEWIGPGNSYKAWRAFEIWKDEPKL